MNIFKDILSENNLIVSIFNQQGECDEGTAYLATITLRNCWTYLKIDEQKTLQQELLRRVENRSLLPLVLSPVVAMIAETFVVLSGDEKQGKKEVAKWALEVVEVSKEYSRTG